MLLEIDPYTGKKLVFLVGAPRSGTTWLQLLLSQSAHIASWQETHLFSMYLRSMFSSWAHFANQNRGRGLSSLLTEDEFASALRNFCATCLSKILNHRPDATVILEKTPNHGLLAPEILRIFPQACFLHIIRDPRAVVNSILAASKGWGTNWAPASLTDACEMWITDVAQAQSISSLTPNYKELRYEDLHSDTAGALHAIFCWLGEDCTRERLEEYVRSCAIEKLRSSDVDAPWDLKTEPPQFFRQGEVDSWRTELTPSDIAIIERLTRKHMARLGYKPIATRKAHLSGKVRVRLYRVASRIGRRVSVLPNRLKP